MPRPKKNTTTKTIVKEEAAVKAAANAEVKAVKPTEAAEVKAAPAQAPKTEAKKPAEKKPAEKKSAEKKPAEKKSAEKKSPAKAEPAPAAKKRVVGRKPKPVTVDDIVAKIYKKIDAAAAKNIVSQGKAAVDIKLYGPFEAHMYIEIKNGVVSVAPYDYIEKDIEAAVSVENALAIADGKLTVEEAVENGALYVFGNVQFALMFAKLFK